MDYYSNLSFALVMPRPPSLPARATSYQTQGGLVMNGQMGGMESCVSGTQLRRGGGEGREGEGQTRWLSFLSSMQKTASQSSISGPQRRQPVRRRVRLPIPPSFNPQMSRSQRYIPSRARCKSLRRAERQPSSHAASEPRLGAFCFSAPSPPFEAGGKFPGGQRLRER